MNYNLKGEIVKISDRQIFDSGAAKLTFSVRTDDQYNDPYEFELYKGKDYVEHLDKFLEFNSIGDFVDVEFNIKSKNWTNPKTDKEMTFTSLSCWRVDKIDGGDVNVPAPDESEGVDHDDLPF